MEEKNTLLRNVRETYIAIHRVVSQKITDGLCGLVVRVPGYITEGYCASCEVRTEFIYVM
jgi:hypothetical protein